MSPDSTDADDDGARPGADRDAPSDESGVRSEEVSFSRAGVRDGFRTALPVAVGLGGYGVVFGVLARRAGLTVAEATLMSATVFAGAAQVVAVEIWRDPVPVAAVVGAVTVVNLRYALMGAALRPWFRHLSPAERYGSLFFSTDESWALTVAHLRSGSGQGAFMLGSGLALWVTYVGGTALGAAVGGLVADPRRWGLNFLLTTVFLVLAESLWEGRRSLAPWATAAAAALAGARLLPGEWYIVLGGAAAGLAEVVRRG